jgi:hypothetical protein
VVTPRTNEWTSFITWFKLYKMIILLWKYWDKYTIFGFIIIQKKSNVVKNNHKHKKLKMCRIVFATFVSGHSLGKWFNDPHNQWKWWITFMTNHVKMFTSSFMKCFSNIASKRSPFGGSTLRTILKKWIQLIHCWFFLVFMALHLVIINVNYLVGWDNWSVSFGRFANENFYFWSFMILTFWLSIICIELS